MLHCILFYTHQPKFARRVPKLATVAQMGRTANCSTAQGLFYGNTPFLGGWRIRLSKSPKEWHVIDKRG